ncbi:MAG: serine hydrolase [Candidatus Bathyarchaeota archaeon]|nr:serine hydrolase [Candidatus Bathyarchaeota archaeon]
MNEDYFPPSEKDGGWRVGDPENLGVDTGKLYEAISYHDNKVFTKSHGGALLIIYKGHIIGESYVTGTEGGPQPWTAQSCNDVKSSTKSVFGTAMGVFLDEYKDRVNLDSYLVGKSREDSLIPQIWDQPVTDERKKNIKVKHAISMTSGHETPEPWLAPSPRHHYPGYTGALQMYEYCFGWWSFEGVPAHHTLLFEPEYGFNYSNYGLEQMALAMRNISGEQVGPYVYDRVLGEIGMPIELRDNQYRVMVYNDPRELNFSDESGWGVGGSKECNAYGADKSESPYGYNTIVGSTFRCTARDFARLGYLWLHKGRWGSKQLVPEEWMKQATRRFVQANGESHNYGFTFWIQDEWENVPKDTYASRGHNMNDSYIIPSRDLVVVRMGNDNPPRGDRSRFIETVIEKIAAAIPK